MFLFLFIYMMLIRLELSIFVSTTAKRQWQRTQDKLLESKKPFGLDLSTLKTSPSDEKKIIEIAMKFAFQIDSIILNLYSGTLLRRFGCLVKLIRLSFCYSTQWRARLFRTLLPLIKRSELSGRFDEHGDCALRCSFGRYSATSWRQNHEIHGAKRARRMRKHYGSRAKHGCRGHTFNDWCYIQNERQWYVR